MSAIVLRELDDREIDHVSGGVAPLLVAAAATVGGAVIAAAAHVANALTASQTCGAGNVKSVNTGPSGMSFECKN